MVLSYFRSKDLMWFWISIMNICAGVPQGSILGPLLFLIYINDIVSNIHSKINLFADDTSLYPDDTASLMQADIQRISTWADTWLVKFNPTKSESMIISRKINKPIHPPLNMFNVMIPTVDVHKHLGILLSKDGSWHNHIGYIKEKAWGRIHILRKLKYTLNRRALETIYISFIRPVLEYSDVVWDNCCNYEKDELDKIHREVGRIVSGCTRLVSIDDLYSELQWETLRDRRRKHKLILLYKMINGLVPEHLSSLVPPTVGDQTEYRSLRNASNIRTVTARTSLYSNSFLPDTLREWNNLPREFRDAESLSVFKALLNQNRIMSNKLFYYGCRKMQTIHTRLRTKCSSLNHHLFLKNIIDSPLCSCGQIETTEHYFVNCPLYSNIRHDLINTVTSVTQFSIDVLLYGDNTRSFNENVEIFDAVHQYIKHSKRFEN